MTNDQIKKAEGLWRSDASIHFDFACIFQKNEN
jgi:hypothetical protein